MKIKKYWKIVLPLTVIAVLAAIYIANIKIAKPDSNTVEGNVIVESAGDSEISNDENSDDGDGIIEKDSDEGNSESDASVNSVSEDGKFDSESKESIEGNTSISKENVDDGEDSSLKVSSTSESVQNTKSKAAVNKSSCSFSIDCYTVLNNKSNLKSGKEKCLGDNGFIYSGTVEVTEGESVKDLLLNVCKENNIKVTCKGDYITGINNLMEKDCGKLSGWMYSVNGVYPMKSVGSYKLSKNDIVKFRYTCNCGKDIQ